MSTQSTCTQTARLPKLVPVTQRFSDEQIPDLSAALHAQFQRQEVSAIIRPGQSVALLLGPSPAVQLVSVLQAVSAELLALGATSYLVPFAGVAASAIAQSGLPVRNLQALEQADHILPIAQIRAHDVCHGSYEHGLCEALCCGFDWAAFDGNPSEASHALQTEAAAALDRLPVGVALALVENAYHHLHTVELIHAADILAREPELLQRSKSLMPRLYFDKLDIRAVGQIGQDISEFGLDPNVTGRTFGLLAPRVDTGTDITRIVAERLSDGSHGNAAGVGNCDFIPQSLYQQIDMQATAATILSNNRPEIARIPMIAKDLDAALQAAFQTCFVQDPAEVKMARIADTRHLEQIEISENLLPYCLANPDKFIVA